jgi:hypothetical protein
LASAEATRKARHTMGKQQKKLIKGVTTQPATPEPAPAQPANAAPSKS